jgi:hypothetical protein
MVWRQKTHRERGRNETFLHGQAEQVRAVVDRFLLFMPGEKGSQVHMYLVFWYLREGYILCPPSYTVLGNPVLSGYHRGCYNISMRPSKSWVQISMSGENRYLGPVYTTVEKSTGHEKKGISQF